jgi:hypothetical protein
MSKLLSHLAVNLPIDEQALVAFCNTGACTHNPSHHFLRMHVYLASKREDCAK